MLNFARSHWTELLDQSPRRCIYCHEPVHEFLTSSETLELIERNKKKGLLQHSDDSEAATMGLPNKFTCQRCNFANSKQAVVKKFGLDVVKWRCVACNAYYKERKKHVKKGKKKVRPADAHAAEDIDDDMEDDQRRCSSIRNLFSRKAKKREGKVDDKEQVTESWGM